MLKIEQLTLKKKIAEQLPKFNYNGDAGFTIAQIWAGEAIGWCWSENIGWRNGVGIAVLIKAMPGQHVFVTGMDDVFKKYGGKEKIPFFVVS